MYLTVNTEKTVCVSEFASCALSDNFLNDAWCARGDLNPHVLSNTGT